MRSKGAKYRQRWHAGKSGGHIGADDVRQQAPEVFIAINLACHSTYILVDAGLEVPD